MRIGINARRLEGQPLGVARYIEYLLAHWRSLFRDDEEARLYVREPLPPDRLPSDRHYAVEVVRPKLQGFAWENVALARAIRDVDVFFGPSYSLPLPYRGRAVVAIHSVNEIQEGTHQWWYPLTYTRLYRASARKAARVIVPTESVRRDLEAAYGINGSRIAVVPQGVDDDFRRVEDDELLRSTRIELLGEDRPYVVFVGKLSQRRNIPLLIEAFAQATRLTPELPHKLLLFGPNHLNLPLERIAEEQGIADRVVQTDGVLERHHDLTRIYSAADAYISASAYEGFSMTAVEAMACGTPVVGVDRAAFAEIVDGAGRLVPDPSVQSLAEALAEVLVDGELRRTLGARGSERAARFRWHDIARDTLEILREVAES